MAKRAHIKLTDGINALPDELLVCVLCFLSLKEAAATSILCRRWRYLWTFTDKLDFDGLDFFRNVRSGSKVHEESWSYIGWVNNVLEFHKGCSIEDFRVDFFLSETHKEYIDRWLRVASSKKVQRLELKLKIGSSPGAYTFPCELLINFKHLRTMRMHCVNVSGEGVEFLLRTCPLLEELSVSCSVRLTALKIICPSTALKRLEINYCRNLTSVEIQDANLVFFMYHGKRLQQFVLKNVPLLAEMHVGGWLVDCMEDLLLMLSSYLPQLEKLTIDRMCKILFTDREARTFYNNVKMSNLKQLVFKFLGINSGSSLMPLTLFIRASPLLQSFVLEAYGGREDVSSDFVNRLPEKAVGPYPHLIPLEFLFMGYPHRYCGLYPHLKCIEFIGYRGALSELDMVIHLLENGAAIEKVIVDLRKRDNAWMPSSFLLPNSVTGRLPEGYPCSQDEIGALKTRVKDQLTKRVLPSPVDLKIL